MLVKKRDLFILFYFVVFLIHYFSTLNIYITFVIWIPIGLLGYFILSKQVSRNLSSIVLLISIDLIGGFALLINRSHSIANILILFVSHMLGLYLYCFRKDLKKVVNIIYCMILFMAMYTAITPQVLVNEDFGEYMTKFSTLVGGNSISIFCLLFVSIDLIYRYNSRKKINYFFPILSLTISAIGGGTGGVLALSLLIIGLLCINWEKNRISIIKTVIVIGIGILVLFISSNFYKVLLILSDDNSRFWIWSNYLNCATNSITEFVFGGIVDHISFLEEQRNMHNTFLNLHYYYGLIPCVFYIAVILKTLLYNLKKKNMLMVLILGVLCVRGMTDETTFCFMPIWTYAFLEMKNNSK